jgi:uncharacterized membrane protein YidH (DUF202 family)
MAVLNLGLQRERTSLAWTRTALAMVANGLLVLVRHERSIPLSIALCLSVLWVGLALVTLACASHRNRLVATPDRGIARTTSTVVPLALAVGALCAVTAATIAVT